MGHTECCPDTVDIPYKSLPTTEDRPYFAERITITATDWTGSADVSLPFEPTEILITATSTNPVEISYDGKALSQILEAGEQIRLEHTIRRRFWFRKPSYANGGAACVANFRAAANQRKGHH